MNKQLLVDAIASESGLTKKDAEAALNATTGSIEGALKKGDSVTLVGFGNWTVKDRAARKGRNPSTGAEISIPASKAVSFKAGKQLKEIVK